MVQHRFTFGAAEESIEHSQIPVATTQIIALITRCDFVGNVTTDLNTGLQPFLFTYTSQDANALLCKVTSMAADLHQGMGTTLHDTQALQDTSKIPLPTSMWHALIKLTSFTVILGDEVHGPHHRLTTAY